ncbi:MAG: trypsin-like peptidase domain-containing protein [Gemmatimonadota bacterium]
MTEHRLGWRFIALTLAWVGCTPANGAPEADRAEAEPAELFVARAATRAANGSAQDRAATVSDTLDRSRSTAIVRAASRVAPAVVSINVLRTQQVRPRTAWESFFLPPGAQRRSAGFGSGVIVREDGIVLTNDHVIRDASQIRVTLPDGRDLDAELVGTDAVADIAVLRIRGENLPVAPVGTVEGLMIGEWAVAIGNPLGTYAADAEPTVTAGVVSAVGRNIIPSSDGRGFYFGMIQTDASINPGNSGGPLVNALGEIIGINASIISRSGGSEGLGFAIPIDRALRIADDLVRFGEVRRAWVGIDVEPVDADAWGRTRGVRISRVAPDSPADEAALEVGDRLLDANGRALTGPLDFEGTVMDLRAGDRLVLEIEGQTRPVTLEAVPFPSVTAQRVRVLSDIELVTVTPQIQVERGLTSTDGALITDISGELQSQLGLRAGDVIVQINRNRVRSAEDAATVFESLRGTGRIVMYFERNGDYNMRNFYWSR